MAAPRTRALIAAGALMMIAGIALPAAGGAPASQRAGGSRRPSSGSVPASVPAGRYVALGDSVPYGYGLANAGQFTVGGLRPDMGPSPGAYPTLVARKLGLGMRLRPSGCGLVGDNLSVSGAPAIANTWTGTESNCPHPMRGPRRPQMAVSPNELAAARLAADPPGLVTIQVGADDIHFVGCLAFIFGFPTKLGAVECARPVHGGYRLTSRTVAELASLGRALRTIVRRIHARAPAAEIALIDYYQIIPAAATPLVGSSSICQYMELSPPNSQWRKAIRAQADLIQQKLNGTITGVRKTYRYVKAIDIGHLFAGHEMCAANPKSPRKPDSWEFSDIWDAAHPTAKGQAVIAGAVEKALGNKG